MTPFSKRKEMNMNEFTKIYKSSKKNKASSFIEQTSPENYAILK